MRDPQDGLCSTLFVNQAAIDHRSHQSLSALMMQASAQSRLVFHSAVGCFAVTEMQFDSKSIYHASPQTSKLSFSTETNPIELPYLRLKRILCGNQSHDCPKSARKENHQSSEADRPINLCSSAESVPLITQQPRHPANDQSHQKDSAINDVQSIMTEIVRFHPQNRNCHHQRRAEAKPDQPRQNVMPTTSLTMPPVAFSSTRKQPSTG